MRRAREFMKKDKNSKVEEKAAASEEEQKIPVVAVGKEQDTGSEDQTGSTTAVASNDTLEERKEIADGDDIEDEEDESDDDADFEGISDGDDDDTDGLLIPLENGWVCEKRLADRSSRSGDSESYATHFWSPDGQRHSSLSSIKSYGMKKKLKLNMVIFERALKSNPHK